MKTVVTFLFFAGFSAAKITSSDEGITNEYVKMVMKPSSRSVHYLEINLEAPGYIDLTELSFATVDDGHDGSVPEDDDTIQWDDYWSDNERDTKKTTFVDVAVVFLPEPCNTITDYETNSQHCDFTDVGVGRKYSSDYGTLEESFWCCTDEEVRLGICDGTVASYGRMMLNLTTFEGSHRYVEVPPYGKVSQSIQYGKFEELAHSGKYAIVFSNCHEYAGREVVMQGDLKVKSSGARPEFDVAMKTFAKYSVEMAKEMEEEDQHKTRFHIHISGLTVAWVILGVVAIGLFGQSKLGRLGAAFAGGYNSLELSEMEAGPQSDNGYVPISANW